MWSYNEKHQNFIPKSPLQNSICHLSECYTHKKQTQLIFFEFNDIKAYYVNHCENKGAAEAKYSTGGANVNHTNNAVSQFPQPHF
jgi:hypothetical protein